MESPITFCQVPITSWQIPVTFCQLAITSCQITTCPNHAPVPSFVAEAIAAGIEM